MKTKIAKSVESLFSISILLAILGGGIIFLFFLVAIITGGQLGQTLAVYAADIIMPYFIRLASIGVLLGLISFYIRGEHSLSLDRERKKE